MTIDYEIEIVRKNTRSLVITVTDSTGDIIDLTGFSMKMAVKKSPQDADANALIGPITGTIAAPTTGVGTIQLTSTHTDVPGGVYYYDIKIQNADESSRHTVVGPSKFTVIDNVTQG